MARLPEHLLSNLRAQIEYSKGDAWAKNPNQITLSTSSLVEILDELDSLYELVDILKDALRCKDGKS